MTNLVILQVILKEKCSNNKKIETLKFEIFLLPEALRFGIYIRIFNFISAPGAYEIKETDHAQAYSFGIKTDLTKASDTPAPNAYKAPTMDSHVSYSFGVKPQESQSFSSPGTCF